MNKLTVVIPTIGRKSLRNVLQSIDVECDIILSLDKSAELSFIKDLISDLNLTSRTEIVLQPNHGDELQENVGPGPVKQLGIDMVRTEYFMILDDDDILLSGYLKYALELLDKTKADWMATHDSRNIFEMKSTSWIKVTKESFMQYYYDFDHYERKLNSIYPGSEVICKTDTFKAHSSVTNHKFELNYLDDVIPMVSFMSSYDGILHSGYGIVYGIGESSVSHNGYDPFKKSGLTIVILQVSKLFIKTGNPVWKRALANLLSNTRYNYSHYK